MTLTLFVPAAVARLGLARTRAPLCPCCRRVNGTWANLHVLNIVHATVPRMSVERACVRARKSSPRKTLKLVVSFFMSRVLRRHRVRGAVRHRGSSQALQAYLATRQEHQLQL